MASIIILEGKQVPLLSSLKYLSIHLKNKVTMFSLHLRTAADKATRVMNTLSGLMPNVKGPSEGKRRLLGSVVQSVLRYGTPCWASLLVNNAGNTAILTRVQRRVAIRCVAAYRTVSYDAITLVVRIPPIVPPF